MRLNRLDVLEVMLFFGIASVLIVAFVRFTSR